MNAGLAGILTAIRPKLLRFLELRGGGAECDDILQEVWLRASQVQAPLANPEAYLFRCAHNIMIDRHRSERQRGLREQAWAEISEHSGQSQDECANPERQAIARAQLDRALAAIDALGEPTGTIFRSYRIDGTPQRQIAEQLGLALPTIEKHLQRAYKAMAAARHDLGME